METEYVAWYNGPQRCLGSRRQLPDGRYMYGFVAVDRATGDVMPQTCSQSLMATAIDIMLTACGPNWVST